MYGLIFVELIEYEPWSIEQPAAAGRSDNIGGAKRKSSTSRKRATSMPATIRRRDIIH